MVCWNSASDPWKFESEIVPLVGIDQALVEALEHVHLYVAQPESDSLGRQGSHELSAAPGKQRPVEEVGLDGADDALVGQQPARQHLRWIIDRKIEYSRRDRFDEYG